MSAKKGVLVYNESKIGFLGQAINLTNMWQASGSPPKQSPYDWMQTEQFSQFAEFLAENLKPGFDGFEGKPGVKAFGLVWTKRGGNDAATWAHWQLAFAYAKYLSPEFHAWVNQAAREKMEAISGSAPSSVDELDLVAATARATALFRSYNFIAKLTGLGKNQAMISANQAARKHTGVDLLSEIGLVHIPAPEQTHLLNATDIGLRLGGISAQAVNMALASRGYQVRVEVCGKKAWEATKKGLPYSEMQDTAKKHSNGTPIRQLKWKASILDELADMRLTDVVEPTPVPFSQTPA